MKHILKRGLALLCMLTLLLGVLPVGASAAELGEFTVLSTTDMHGRCWDTNLLTGGSVSNSMLNVATAVAKIRSEKSNVILIDNGDTYQGTPVSSYQLSQQAAGLTTDPNPMALSLAEIGYDVSVLGNHEFNYAWSTMGDVRTYLESKGVSTVTANLYYDGSDGVHAKGENVFTPYVMQTVTADGKDYKIAVIGFENTDCPRWDVADNYPGIVFTHPDNTYGSMAWEAERYIAKAKADGADAIIVAYHSGLGTSVKPEEIQFGVNSENQILSMIANTEGIDLVIAGHDHSSSYSGTKYADKNGKEVPVVNGGGVNLTCTTFSITDSGIVFKEHKDLSLSSYAADTALKAKIQPYAEAADAYVSQTVGSLTGTWNTVANYYLEQSDAMDLINRAQIAQGSLHMAEKYDTAEKVSALYAETGLDHLTVDVSSTSVVITSGYKVQAGEMSMKDIYKLYRYDNTLYLVPLTGQQIKDIMEFNASERLSVNTASGQAVFGTKGDNFTNPVFYGLDFTYDMSKEAGSRVVIEKFADGRAFDLNKTYLMAINNYHLGNGPFADYSTEDAVWSQSEDMEGGVVQDLIAEFLRANPDGVSPAPSKWSLTYTGEISTGTADGAYIADLITDAADLADGDKVFILHVAGSQLVSTVADGSKLAPSADVTLGDKQLGTSDETTMFTLKKGSDGYLRFVGADGTYLTSAPTGNGLSMSAENEYSLWELEAKEGSTGIFHVHSVNAAYNGNTNQYLEFYSGFTTYGFQSGGGAYEYMIFRLSGSGPKPTEPTEPTSPTEPTEPTNPTNPITPCSHTYQASAVAATCTEPGYTLYTCSKCGESYRSSFVPALGHNFVNGTCTRCGAADPDYVPVDEPTEGRPLYASFRDLEKEAWYRDGIVYALKNGLMNGVDKYVFDPDGEVTRAMLVTILYRAAGSPNAKGLKIPFEDVEPGTWYTDAVAWAADRNIVLGVSDTEFAPDASITREQLAAILYRYVGEPAPAGNLAAYIDAKEVSSYAINALKWAIGEKIITGIDNRLAPQETATRAQIATVFFRFLDPVAAQESQERLENDPNPYD